MIFFILIGAVLTADLMIKRYAENHLTDGENRLVLKGKILIRKYHNDGAALGFLKGKRWLLSAVTLTMILRLVLILLGSLRYACRLLFKTGLSLIIGGALSNWVDRARNGYVTDYFSFNVKWKKLRQIVFNLGDICIFMGLLSGIRKGDR